MYMFVSGVQIPFYMAKTKWCGCKSYNNNAKSNDMSIYHFSIVHAVCVNCRSIVRLHAESIIDVTSPHLQFVY